MAKYFNTNALYVPQFWNPFCEDEPAYRPQIFKQRNYVKCFARLGYVQVHVVVQDVRFEGEIETASC